MTAATLAAAPGLEPRRFSAALPALLLLAITVASGSALQGVFSTVQEAAKADLHLTDTQLGLVQGLATSIPLAVLSVPLGLLVDRVHRIRILIVMAIGWVIGSALTAYTHSFALLFVARMLAGLGASTAVTVAISLAADMCPPAQRGRSMLILTLGKWLGTAAAFALGGWLFGRFGTSPFAGLAPWRGVHLALAIGAGAAILTLLALREPPRAERSSVEPLPIKAVFSRLWSMRGFLAPLFGGQVGVVMADAAAAIWAAPVLSREFGLTPDQFAGWMGLVIFGSGVTGSILGGVAADWGVRGGKQGGILIGAVIASAIAIPATLFPIAPSPVLFGVALSVLLTGGTITGLITATAITVTVPNDMRGLCVGLFLAVSGLVAFGVSPTLVTAVSTMLGGEAYLGTALAAVGLLVSVLACWCFIVAKMRTPIG
ncbi:MFS transporter [Novosphingobium sp. 9U]|uniref:MFS transporter n=1 Tax=Novosphingobium sp. 9U TaxID=2653158 RepID=UPI0012EF7F16|nr:MFS transporter [Novosphingobium sp. 9U]VWX54119.1 MFS transporter [Novosphingobium sp. 9U]